MTLDAKAMEWAAEQGLDTKTLKASKVPIYGKWYFPEIPAGVPLVNLKTGEIQVFGPGLRAGEILFVARSDLRRARLGPYAPKEEVAEEPYKIDGMLSRLALEGTLRRLRGVALGSFTACVPKRGRRELPTPVVLRDHLARLGIPVLSGIPAGHGKRNRPVPLGALATLDARRRVLRFEEGLVS